jgi:hypothetical protein
MCRGKNNKVGYRMNKQAVNVKEGIDHEHGFERWGDSIKNKRELSFARNFFTDNNWDYQPGPYYLSNNTKYTPDFLDRSRNVLIEVVGSRQAYHQNKAKYKLFANEYPDLRLEFRSSSGEELHPVNGHLFTKATVVIDDMRTS